MNKKEPVRKIIGTVFTFRQYMCSKCQKLFFIPKKEGLPLEESWEEEMRIYQSPCCKPFHRQLNPDKLIEPHGIYIRTLKLKVEEIADEIALVAKRRVAAENGKPDPYRDTKKDTEDDDDET